MEYILILSAAFFLVALVYASVGFGGGSSYLALLALPLFALPFPVIRATALCCNLIVVSGGCYIFYRDGMLKWREVWPYLLSSVPMAYVGGQWPLREETFFVLLGVTLLVVSALLWFQPESAPATSSSPSGNVPAKLAIGGGIGLLSGLVGIGGGIFLSPVIHFLRWSDGKRIAALASIFILVNSVGGLVGQFRKGIPALSVAFLLPLLLAVLVGGQVGTRLGARRFSSRYIRRITALLIFVAGIVVLHDHL